MGTSLTGVNISQSYLGLLKSTDSLAISTSAKRITDGAGNDLPIKLSTNQMFFNVGTASAPALSFDGNTSEGFYVPEDETIAITLGGAEKFRFASNTFIAPDGSSTTPALAFNNDTDTGVFRNGSGVIGFSSNSTVSGEVTLTGYRAKKNSTASAPNYSFIGETTTGLHSLNTGEIDLITAGDVRLNISNAGSIKFNNYGSGNNTGTVTQRLGVTSAGQVVEIPIGAGALDGSGTAGKIAKFTDSDTLGDSIITEDSSNIGIGDSSPSFPLVVNKSGDNVKLDITNGVNANFRVQTSGAVSLIGPSTATLAFMTSSTERMRLNSTGLGIGTTSPNAKLEISDATNDNLRIGTRGGNINIFSVNDAGATAPLRLEASDFQFINGNSTFAGQVLCDTNTTSPAGGEAVFYKSSAGAVLSGFQAILETGSAGSRATALTLDNSQNATFAGAVTLSSTLPLLYLTNTTSGTGKNWRLSSATNGKFFISEEGVVDGLTLEHTTGNATFAGKITSSDDIIISNSSPELYMTTGGSHRNWLLAAQESIDGGFEIASQPSSGGSYDILFAIKGDTGNVGIGTTSPSRKLTVQGTGDSYVAVISPTTDTAGILLGDTDAEYMGRVVYSNSANALQLFSNNAERMRITSGGSLRVGDTSHVWNDRELVTMKKTTGEVYATQTDDLNYSHWVAKSNGASSSTHYLAYFVKSDDSNIGSITHNDTATAYNTSSDYRLKEDLKDFNALEIASKIKMYDFKWKAGDSRSYGVMAHELQEVVPQAVSGDKDAEEMQQVDYSKLVPILLKSIQELKAEIDELKKEI